VLCIVLAAMNGTVLAGWSQFRGPNGSGLAEGGAPVAIRVEAAEWKVPLPPGNSSPVLADGRVVLTALEGGRLVTLALDAETGRGLWKALVPEVALERVHQVNSVASSTPCADERAVYVYFGSYGLLCYDLEGVVRWEKPIPTPESMYGVSTSPILDGERLILVLDDDADLPGSRLSRSKVIALEKETGELIWETARPYNRGGWSTPMLWRQPQKTDLVVLGNGRMYGYSPMTGEERWSVSGFAREPIAVPVAGEGMLFASVSMQGGRGDVRLDPEPFWESMLYFDRDGDSRIGRGEITVPFTLPLRPELTPEDEGFGIPLPSDPARRRARQEEMFAWRDRDGDGYWTKEEFTREMEVGQGRPHLMAIRAGGRGDVTESHLEWNLQSGIPEIPSPVYHAGRLYLVRDGGILSCVRARDGEVVYRERLGASGQYSASPVIAGDCLYLISGKGVLTVVGLGDVFKVRHQANLGASVTATPAIEGGRLYLRTQDGLLAFGGAGNEVHP